MVNSRGDSPVNSPYSVADAGLPDEGQVPATGDWTYGVKRVGRTNRDRSIQPLQAAGIAFVLAALSPLTSVADPWFAERKREPTASFARSIEQARKARISVRGSYQPDEDNPRSGRVTLSHADASFTGTLNIEETESVDRQSVGPLDSQLEKRPTLEVECASLPAPAPDCWEILGNTAQPVDDRIASLNACIAESPLRVAAFIVSELKKPSISGMWRNHLVLAAESMQFLSQGMREELADRLLAIARELRNSRQTFDASTVWSALRTYASLIPRNEVVSLLEFLNGQGTVDTRLVALQCVARMFEPALPEPGQVSSVLADCVYIFAEKMTDPLVITPGEVAAIALNAICALAAIRDPRLPDTLARVVKLKKPWFARQVRQRLHLLAVGWQPCGTGAQQAIDAIHQQTESLASTEIAPLA